MAQNCHDIDDMIFERKKKKPPLVNEFRVWGVSEKLKKSRFKGPAEGFKRGKTQPGISRGENQGLEMAQTMHSGFLMCGPGALFLELQWWHGPGSILGGPCGETKK